MQSIEHSSLSTALVTWIYALYTCVRASVYACMEAYMGLCKIAYVGLLYALQPMCLYACVPTCARARAQLIKFDVLVSLPPTCSSSLSKHPIVYVSAANYRRRFVYFIRTRNALFAAPRLMFPNPLRPAVARVKSSFKRGLWLAFKRPGRP